MSSEQIGKYRVQGEIAAGGMGIIYLAVDPTLDRPVAIKAMRPEFVSQRKLVERFRNEAIALARLTHPNIAILYEYLEEAGTHYMVMEYIDGLTLEDVTVNEGAMPLKVIRTVFEPVLAALAYAHHEGIVHRDIKPSNIMITRHGVVKITDFGIARLRDRGKLTRTGQGLGSLPYMAPEQIKIDPDNPPDARSDLYALSITLYESLTGKMPFDAETDFAWMQAHLQTPPPDPCKSVSTIPTALGMLVQQGMAKKPADRPDSAEDYQASLREACPGDPKAIPKAWFKKLAVPSFDATIVPDSARLGGQADGESTRLPRRWSAKALWSALAGAIILAGAIGWYFWQGRGTGDSGTDHLADTTAMIVDGTGSAAGGAEQGNTGTDSRTGGDVNAGAGRTGVTAAPNLILRVFPRSENDRIDVWVDGTLQPAGQLQFDRVRPGLHEVRIRKGKDTFAQRIDIPAAGSREVKFDFTRTRGDLRIGFETTDGSLLYLADLFIDGEKVNKEAPTTLADLPSGSHRVEIAAEGYRLEGGARYIEVKPAETAELFFRLAPAP